ncbi:hypothetical protein AX15_001421 [Amanita polypyramis BW_CC]|nr:hypothetical protein AX15_001421 [Amanita polypyramis BW_CC]
MAFLGLRKWSTPVLRPMWPFMVGGSVVAYLIYGLQEKAVRSEEWRKDARNPYAAQIAKESLH